MSSAASNNQPTTRKTPNTKQELIAANIKLLIQQLEAGKSDALTNYLTAMSRFHMYKSGELMTLSVCTTWGRLDGRSYLFRHQLDYSSLKRGVLELSEKWRPNVILIEDKASGTQLIQALQSSGLYNMKPYDPIAVMDKGRVS